MGEMVRVENMGHEFFVYLKVADYELTARVPSDEAKPMIERDFIARCISI
jgi:oligogalacturonide transport system ATP-binding protein